MTGLSFDTADTSTGIYENTLDNRELATFTYSGDAAPIAATINWGDGHTTIGKFVLSGGTTYVYADDMHYYTSTATETATITLLMPDGTTYTTWEAPPRNRAQRYRPSAQPAPGAFGRDRAELRARFRSGGALQRRYSGHDALLGLLRQPLRLSAYITWESPSGEDHIMAATVDYGESITGHVPLIEGDYSYFSDGTKTAAITVVGQEGATATINVSIAINNALTDTLARSISTT